MLNVKLLTIRRFALVHHLLLVIQVLVVDMSMLPAGITETAHPDILVMAMSVKSLAATIKIAWLMKDVSVERVELFATAMDLAEKDSFAKTVCVKWDAGMT